MMFLEKVIVSVLSTLILSLSLAFWEYTPAAEQQTGVAYFSFNGLFIIYFMYSLPVYLIGGGLYSWLVDVYFGKIQFRNKFFKYVIEFLAYAAGGLLIIGLILTVILLLDGGFPGTGGYKIFIFGVLSALLFFHISLVFKKTLFVLAR